MLVAAGELREASGLARPIAEDPDADAQARLRAITAAATGRSFSGDPQGALDLCEALVPLGLEHLGELPRGIGWVMAQWINALVCLGRLEEARVVVVPIRAQAIEDGDDEVVCGSSLVLGKLALLGGDLESATTMLREAEVAFRVSDPAGYRPWCLGLLAQAAAQRGDLVGARAAVAELDALDWVVRLNDHDVTIGRAWAAAAAGEITGPVDLLVRAAQEASDRGSPFVAGLLLHEALRIGGDGRVVVESLGAVAAVGGLPWHVLFHRHAQALVDDDGVALEEIAATFEVAGMLLVAAECATQAAAAYRAAGFPSRASRATGRSDRLRRACPDARTPALAGRQPGRALTRRETGDRTARGCRALQPRDRRVSRYRGPNRGGSPVAGQHEARRPGPSGARGRAPGSGRRVSATSRMRITWLSRRRRRPGSSDISARRRRRAPQFVCMLVVLLVAGSSCTPVSAAERSPAPSGGSTSTPSSGAAAPPGAIRQPRQPATGPGGRDLPHRGWRVSSGGAGADAWYVFEPTRPRPRSAPVAVVMHGYGEFSGYDTMYELVRHTVRGGSIVIYPRWQTGLTTPCPGPFDIEPCMDAAVTAIRGALDFLGTEHGHVEPRLDRASYFGFSFGGIITANLVNRYARLGLPRPRAVFLDDPHDGGLAGKDEPALDDSMSGIPPDVLFECHVGAEGVISEAGSADASCNALFPKLGRIPGRNKNLVLTRPDAHGRPALSSHHGVCASPRGSADAVRLELLLEGLGRHPDGRVLREGPERRARERCPTSQQRCVE